MPPGDPSEPGSPPGVAARSHARSMAPIDLLGIWAPLGVPPGAHPVGLGLQWPPRGDIWSILGSIWGPLGLVSGPIWPLSP